VPKFWIDLNTGGNKLLNDFAIRRVSFSDYQDIIELNRSEVQYTSPMDLERLTLLDSLSTYHKVALIDNQAAGFILVMKDHAAYVNDNFNWFSLRYEDFLYVDRIVVGKDYQILKEVFQKEFTLQEYW